MFNTTVSSPPGPPFACEYGEDLEIGQGPGLAGSLSAWGTGGEFLVDQHISGNTTMELDINDTGSVTVGGGGLLTVNGTEGVRLAIQGSVTIFPGGNLTLSPSSSLVLERGGSLVVDGGSLFLNGSKFIGDGGIVQVDNGGTIEGSGFRAASPGVSDLDVEGSLDLLNDTLSPVGWLNVSGNVGALDLSGYYSLPVAIRNVTIAEVGTFRADNVVLDTVTFATAQNVFLGSATSSSADHITVNGLTVGQPVGNLSVAHALVESFGIARAQQVTVVNSTFEMGSSSITQATSSFTANGSSRFDFPLVFNNAPWVNLTNVSAPSISVQGFANVTVYNWQTNTSISSGGVADLPTITTSSTSVAVHVYRYVLVSVQIGGTAATVPGITVSVCGFDPTASCLTAPVGPQGTVGRFVLTDVVTSGGVDSFVGTYTISASAPGGYTAPSSTQTLTTDDVQVTLQLSAPVISQGQVPLFLAEVAAMAAVVAAMVYLRTQIRRMRRLRAVPKEETRPSRRRMKGAGPEPGSVERKGSERRPAPSEWKGPGP